MKRDIITTVLLLLCPALAGIAAGPAAATNSLATELVTSSASEAVLHVSEMWSYNPHWNCLGASLELQNDVAIAAMQVDIQFNTTCIEVEGIGKTRRTEPFGIFNWTDIPGGIRIALTGIGHQIDPGNGPVVIIYFHFSANDCPELDPSWHITDAVLSGVMTTPIQTVVVEYGPVRMSQWQKGDINEDGIVNSLDVVLGVRMVLGLQDETWAADYDADGRMNVEDILLMIESILGRGTCPP